MIWVCLDLARETLLAAHVLDGETGRADGGGVDGSVGGHARACAVALVLIGYHDPALPNGGVGFCFV